MNHEWKPQRQDDLASQLRDLISLAEREGCYDAADYLKRVIENPAPYQANLIVDGTTGELVPAPWMEADPSGERLLRCLICGYTTTTEYFDLHGTNPGLQDATFCPRCASTRGSAWAGTE